MREEAAAWLGRRSPEAPVPPVRCENKEAVAGVGGVPHDAEGLMGALYFMLILYRSSKNLKGWKTSIGQLMQDVETLLFFLSSVIRSSWKFVLQTLRHFSFDSRHASYRSGSSTPLNSLCLGKSCCRSKSSL